MMSEAKPRAPRSWTIEAEALAVAHLRDVIGRDAEDADLFLDMVEGETSFLECLDRLLGVIADHDALADGAKAMAARFEKRASSARERADHYRAVVETSMLHAGLEGPVRRPGGTVSLRQSPPSLVIEEEGEIPSQFFERQPPKLDTKGLKAALKDSPKGSIPGARLQDGARRLTIRR